jgi:Sugar (and other) transporter
MIVPLYIGEVVPPRVRGALVSFNQLAITSAFSFPTWSTTDWRPARTGG